MYNDLTRRKKTAAIEISEIRNKDYEVLTNKELISEEFSKSFVISHTDNGTSFSLISTLPASNSTFTYEDVEFAFKKHKPTSHADIPYIYFSHLLYFLSPKLAVIFSTCLAQGIFPSSLN